MLVYDIFSAHKTDSVQAKLITNNLTAVEVPSGCTSKCQPLDVSLNKPFKDILRRC